MRPTSIPSSLEADKKIAWEKIPEPWRSNLSPQTLNDLAQFPDDWPELEIFPIASTTLPVNDTANYATFSMVLVAPTSHGNVTLNSTDTTYNPLIYPNWYGTSTDQEVAVAAFHRIRQLVNATGLTVGPEFFPGPSVQSDEQILESLKNSMTTIHHAAGTCQHQPVNTVLLNSGKLGITRCYGYFKRHSSRRRFTR